MGRLNRPPPWWLRAYLLFAAAQGLGIGLTGLLIPSEMQIPLSLTPLNARFTAALYIAGGVGVLWAALVSRRRADTVLFVLGFGVATALILVLTIVHWPAFMADDLPHRPVWIFDYVVDPLLALIIVPAAGLWPASVGTTSRLTSLFILQAILFGALGLALLFAPDAVAAAWPWSLPPLLGQLYGCFFLTFAIGAGLAARESSSLAIQGFTLSSLALMALVLVASLVHLDRFKPEPVSWIWFASFAIGVYVFAVIALAQHTSPSGIDRLVRVYGFALGAGLLLEGGILLVLGTLSVAVPALPIPLTTGDTRHNALHVVWGTVFLVVLLSSRSRAVASVLMLVFGIFYTGLGLTGVVMHNPFGLLLGPGENTFHFTVGLLALALAATSLRTSEAFLPTRRSSVSTIR